MRRDERLQLLAACGDRLCGGGVLVFFSYGDVMSLSEERLREIELNYAKAWESNSAYDSYFDDHHKDVADLIAEVRRLREDSRLQAVADENDEFRWRHPE